MTTLTWLMLYHAMFNSIFLFVKIVANKLCILKMAAIFNVLKN
jgi:hypothetical protein